MVYLNEKEKKESRKKNTIDNSITHIRTKWKKKRKKEIRVVQHHANSESIHKAYNDRSEQSKQTLK